MDTERERGGGEGERESEGREREGWGQATSICNNSKIHHDSYGNSNGFWIERSLRIELQGNIYLVSPLMLYVCTVTSCEARIVLIADDALEKFS